MSSSQARFQNILNVPQFSSLIIFLLLVGQFGQIFMHLLNTSENLEIGDQSIWLIVANTASVKGTQCQLLLLNQPGEMSHSQ